MWRCDIWEAIAYTCRRPRLGSGDRETPADVARVLSRYVDCIAARTFRNETVEEIARFASVPVINALSDD